MTEKIEPQYPNARYVAWGRSIDHILTSIEMIFNRQVVYGCPDTVMPLSRSATQLLRPRLLEIISELEGMDIYLVNEAGNQTEFNEEH